MDQAIAVVSESVDTSTVRRNGPKRALDLVLAIPAVVISLPLVLLVAIGATLSLRANPLFAHKRVGMGERLFTIVKVRTLPPTTPQYAAKRDLDPLGPPPFTNWLRNRHLDELPQLWSVVLGTMSLVGPRPEMECLHDQMPGSVARNRTRVRPGCTGLWQLSAQAAGMIHESPEYDRFYIRHQTLRLDIWILWQTVRILVFRRPHITLESVPEWAIRPLRTSEPEVAQG